MAELNMMSKEQFNELVKGKGDRNVSVIDLEPIHFRLTCCLSLADDLSNLGEQEHISVPTMMNMYYLLNNIVDDLEKLMD